MALLSWSALFILVPWGFISFGSSSMVLWDDYTVSQLGFLLTGLSFAMMFGVFVVGIIAEKYDPKKIILGSMLIICAGSFCIIFIDSYWALVLGYVLHGLGISAWKIIPYNQLSLAVPASEYPKYYGIFECCFSMFSPAAARFLMMLCTVFVDSRWGWRLPWVVVLVATAINFFLILFFASFERATSSPGKTKLSEHSYSEKAQELIHSPVGIILLFAVGLSGFGFTSLAVWNPYIAIRTFDTSFQTVQITMAIASMFAYPISVGGAAILVYTTAGRIESGLKYSIFFLVPAAAAALLLPLQTTFIMYAIFSITYLALGFFPYAYYKVVIIYPVNLKKNDSNLLFLCS